MLYEAYALAKSFSDPEKRGTALTAIALHLPSGPRQQIFREAIKTAKTVVDERARSTAVASLAPHLSPELLSEALIAAKFIGDEFKHAIALGALVPYHPLERKEQVQNQALGAARAVDSNFRRSIALMEIASHLSPERIILVSEEASAAVDAIVHEPLRTLARVALVPRLPIELRQHALGEALTIATTHANAQIRAVTIAALAPHLPRAMIGKALAVAIKLQNLLRSEVLEFLAPYVSFEVLKDPAINDVVDDDFKSAISRVTSASAVQLSPQEIEAVIKVEDSSLSFLALVALAQRLAPSSFGAVLSASRFGTIYSDGFAASVLASRISLRFLAEFLAASRPILYDISRTRTFIWTLIVLAPHMTEERREQVLLELLTAIAGMRKLGEVGPIASRDDEQDKLRHTAIALAGFAPYLSPLRRQKAANDALSTARILGNDFWCSIAVALLLPPLSTEQRIELLGRALSEADPNQHDRHRSFLGSPQNVSGDTLDIIEFLSNERRAISFKRLFGGPCNQLSSNYSTALIIELIDVISRTRRSIALTSIMETLECLCNIVDKSTVTLIYQAIQDVSKWYP
jgi:hypothetical protein